METFGIRSVHNSRKNVLQLPTNIFIFECQSQITYSTFSWLIGMESCMIKKQFSYKWVGWTVFMVVGWPWCSGTAGGHQWTGTHTSLCGGTPAEGSWSTPGRGRCCSEATWRWAPGRGSRGTEALDSVEDKRTRGHIILRLFLNVLLMHLYECRRLKLDHWDPTSTACWTCFLLNFDNPKSLPS